MSTQQVSFGPVPIPGPPAMHTGAPIAKLFAVALSAELVGLIEGHAFAACEMEPVAIRGVVAIQAPPMLLVVLQNYFGVHVRKCPANGIRLEIGVAPRAREQPLR